MVKHIQTKRVCLSMFDHFVGLQEGGMDIKQGDCQNRGLIPLCKQGKSYSIPHETVISNDRDPPWTNKDIKELIHNKNQQMYGESTLDK